MGNADHLVARLSVQVLAFSKLVESCERVPQAKLYTWQQCWVTLFGTRGTHLAGSRAHL